MKLLRSFLLFSRMFVDLREAEVRIRKAGIGSNCFFVRRSRIFPVSKLRLHDTQLQIRVRKPWIETDSPLQQVLSVFRRPLHVTRFQLGACVEEIGTLSSRWIVRAPVQLFLIARQ